MVRPLLVSQASMVALLAIARVSAAQDRPTLSGSWTAGALTESWSVSAWGAACGPRPQPQGAAGGPVQIKQQGSELSVTGAGRAWSTTECWEQMPGLSRSKHSASGNARSWQTRCTTPANDPRRATVVTTTQATDATIGMVEVGDYQFIIQDTTCTAKVTRSRNFTLVRREGDLPPVASSPPAAAKPPAPAPIASEAKPAKPRTCEAPGDPVRLEVTPSRKILRPGERFQFRAVVMDADGCALPIRPAWSIASGPLAAAATVDPGGALSIGASAGDGKLALVATVGDKGVTVVGVTVVIDVTSPAQYDALLATSGLNDAGESDQAATAVMATGTIGGRTTAGEDVARQRKNVFVAIVAGVASCLALVGLILLRRGQRRGSLGLERASDEPLAGPEAEPGGVEPAPEPVIRSVDTLVSAGVGAESLPQALQKRGKICPSCGDRYPAEAMFCGKDGMQLVLLN